jgi:hypothetical protein
VWFINYKGKCFLTVHGINYKLSTVSAGEPSSKQQVVESSAEEPVKMIEAPDQDLNRIQTSTTTTTTTTNNTVAVVKPSSYIKSYINQYQQHPPTSTTTSTVDVSSENVGSDVSKVEQRRRVVQATRDDDIHPPAGK